MWLWWQTDPYRAPHFGNPTGPFSIGYLPWNLHTALFMPPILTRQFPWVRPWAMGMALTFTSPALLLAFRAPWRKAWPLWLTILAVMLPALTVYSNGQIQLGARYWIQALPFFLVLMARKPLPTWGKALIVYSVVMMDFLIWQVRMYGLVI